MNSPLSWITQIEDIVTKCVWLLVKKVNSSPTESFLSCHNSNRGTIHAVALDRFQEIFMLASGGAYLTSCLCSYTCIHK